MSSDSEVSVDTIKPKDEPTIVTKVYNRKQARTAAKIGMVVERVKRTTIQNTNKQELKAYRRELAFEHGSKSGKLKKKHIYRELLANFIAGQNTVDFEGEYSLKELVEIGQRIRNKREL